MKTATEMRAYKARWAMEHRRSMSAGELLELSRKKKIWNRNYRLRHAEEIRRKDREFYIANRESVLLKNRESRDRHRDRFNAYQKRRYQSNPKVRAYHKMACAKRRAAQMQRRVVGYNNQIRAIYEKATFLTDTTGVVWSVDHIWPLQGKTASGLHVPWNMQVIPLNENKRKHIKLPIAETQNAH
jgi:hypothetical protein